MDNLTPNGTDDAVTPLTPEQPETGAEGETPAPNGDAPETEGTTPETPESGM